MSDQFTHITARYWHTLRHLRPVQFYGRIWHRLHRPRVELREAPGLRSRQKEWVYPVARPPMMSGADAFHFLNEDGRIEEKADWNMPDKAKLWLYNLHYFDDLIADEAELCAAWHRSLIKRWIAENPPPHGNGWEPYPLSLRIVNWIKWSLAGNDLGPEGRDSLAVQVRYLSRRLEWHLLGNHLFANAKALVFAGLFFEGSEANSWLTKGLAILAQELPEQILADGGHFELSPMYHSIILEDMLDLINLGDTYGDNVSSTIVKEWRQTARAMLDWLAVMCHPDGDISFFNDAAFSIASKPFLIEAYAERLGLCAGALPKEGVTNLEASGYVRIQRGDMVALIDVARIGPDYIPGHAHADTLSFELSLGDQRVIVNSGISQYGAGPERLYQRSTSAHSTVEIESQNSSEVWGGFRVARRARPIDHNIVEKPGEIIISCAHDGYHRLKGRVTHRREWHFGNRQVEIVDHITGTYRTAVARLFLHPDISPTIGERQGTLTQLAGGMLIWCSNSACEITKSSWYPEFGKSVPNHVLTLELSSSKSSMTLKW